MMIHKIGDVSVIRVEETILREPHELFPDFRFECLEPHLNWMAPHCYDPEEKEFLASVHSWVIRTRHHTILVDACTGNHKERPAWPRFHQLDHPYLERLKAAGVAPGDVDFVMCTHLHVDHVGWNTRLVDGRWVPTFPNAKYIFSQREHDYWNPDLNKATQAFGPVFRDSILPVIEAGQALIVDNGFELDDQIQIFPTPGHSPGHLAIRLTSAGQKGIFSGDVMHQPLQVYYPEWNSRYCINPELARRTRRNLLEHCVDTGITLFPAHFCFPHAGRIQSYGKGFAFKFVQP